MTTEHRTPRKGVRRLAALSAIALASTFTALLAATPAHAAGGPTISPSASTNLNATQVIQVQGNAGPLGGGDTSYPALHIAMCVLPLTATSCDTSLTHFGQPVTGNPLTDPHVVDVQPDASGNWGPIDFLVHNVVVNGNGTFQCGGANQCVIGSADSPNPTNHSYDAVQNLSFAAPTISLSPTNVVDGSSVTATGTNFPMTYNAAGQAIYAFQCKIPVTGGSDCDSNPANYAAATVSPTGSFTTNVTVHQIIGTNNCGTVTCSVGTIKNPPGAPDGYSVYSTTALDFPAPPTVAIGSVTGQTVTTAARAGNTINVTGANYTASGTVSAALCDTALTTCSAGDLASSTLAVDGSGNLTGGVVVAAAATTGARILQITDTTSGMKAVQGITILGTPTVSGTPASGGAGTAVGITGSNWNPGSTVTLQGMAGAVASGDAPATVTANASGAITGSYTVNDPATTAIQATDGTFTESQAFAFSGDDCTVPNGGTCSINQNVHFVANPGVLKQAQAGHDIDLGSLTLDGTVQHLTGALNTDTVTDARGTSAGWQLSASLTDLTNGATPTTNGTIAAGNLAWVPACAATSGGTAPTIGTSAALSNSDQLLCSVPSGTGNGIYKADAALNLTVPATADAGTYNAILTLTLS